MAVSYIEELVHSADGKLISKDPLAPYLIVGTRVRIIKSNNDIGIDQSWVGAIGVVSDECVATNAGRVNRRGDPKATEIHLRIKHPRYENDGLGASVYYFYLDMLEVVE